MPASGGDPIASVLRIGFAAGTKMHSNIDHGLKASAKRALQIRIEHEPATSIQHSILSTLKSKYTLINPKNVANNIRTNGVHNNSNNNNYNNNHNKPNGNGAELPVPKTILFPIEKVQLGYRGGLSVGSGMTNLGNTCYLNSTLQALFHVPAFVNWLLSEVAHLECEQPAADPKHPDDITCALIKTFKHAQKNAGGQIKPVCIYSKLKAVSKRLSHGSQEDAHEFMRCLLERLEEGFLGKIRGEKLDNWSKETTPIHQIFGGYIRTEVTCLSCHAVSTTFQHFQDLALDIRKASTLDDALAGYFERERLPEGENAYKCDKCGRKVAATKKYSIERPPNVLCVQLKRFSAMNAKLTKNVQLPQQLDLARFVSPSLHPRYPVRYRLVSLVTHIGQGANMGHYTALALAANGYYYQFDDTNVRQIPQSTIQNMCAYIVLYELERPFPQHSFRAGATAAESTAHKESESASVGGNEAKQPMSNGSPTAGSPAPLTSPVPGTSSLVPYDSDVDSDAENETTESTARNWKVTTEIKKRAIAPSPIIATTSTSAWRVSTVQSSASSEAAVTPAKENGEARSSSNGRENGAMMNGNNADKSRDVVSELLHNNNRVRSWNGTPRYSDLDQNKRESRKRPHEDNYDAEFDRGKAKRRRCDNGRDFDQSRNINRFQERANDIYYHRNKNRHDYHNRFHHSRPKQGFNSGYRRNYNNGRNNYKYYNNYQRH